MVFKFYKIINFYYNKNAHVHSRHFVIDNANKALLLQVVCVYARVYVVEYICLQQMDLGSDLFTIY